MAKDALGHGSDARGGAATHQQGINNLPQKESIDSRELRLFADNDANLYRQSTQPIIDNLGKKLDKGVYDSGKAAKLWGYHADRAAQAYSKQFGTRDQKWHQMFSPAVRREAAQNWERDMAPRIKAGEFK